MRPFLLIALACAVGCAAQPSPDGTVFPSMASSVNLHQSGGLTAMPAAGSTCTPVDESYTYVLATQVLSWQVCSSPTPSGVYAFVLGHATLDDNASAQLADALRALELPPQPCGSDLQATLVFATPNGDVTDTAAECLVGYDDMTSVIYAAAQ